MSNIDKTPSIDKTAFCCPHCAAYTSQEWSVVYLSSLTEDDNKTPNIPSLEKATEFENDHSLDEDVRDLLVDWVKEMVRGRPFVEEQKNVYVRSSLQNVHTSQCYNCGQFSIWVKDQLIYPNKKIDIQVNQDLPQHIKDLFEEAKEIVAMSPKGAAALLRLAIQYLCKELGESGKDINGDIARLVVKGLNPLVQKALDVVRVVGNESVHPGSINLDDNRDIALQLFGLINLIAEQMITHPKHVEQLYSALPAEKLAGIEKRDNKSSKA